MKMNSKFEVLHALFVPEWLLPSTFLNLEGNSSILASKAT